MMKVRSDARRPRKATLRVFLTLFKAILIAAFVVYALYYFSQSSFFALQKIEVSGQSHLTPAEVASQSGLSDGVNIFQINLNQAREHLLTDPWIVGAVLRRQLPNKVEIDVEERQPSALLIAGQNWLVLDRNGVCIDNLPSLRLYSLPIITGLTPDTTEPGKKISASPVLPVVLAALDLSVEDFFSEVDLANPESLIGYTRDGIPIYLGDSQNLHSKLLTAQSLMAGLNDPGAVAYIDLRSAQAPAVKYKTSTAPAG
jgi:cell division protein FtsQ